MMILSQNAHDMLPVVPVAMGIAAAVAVPLIEAGISGLFSLFGGKAQSNATKDAAAISAASTSQALEYAKEQAALAEKVRQEETAYSRAQDLYKRNLNAPYAAAGGGAMATLGALTTPGQRLSGDTVSSTTGRYAPQTIGALLGSGGRLGQPSLIGTDPNLGTSSAMVPAAGNTAPTGATPAPTEAMQKWMAPDGEVREFPESQWAALKAAGAQRVA